MYPRDIIKAILAAADTSTLGAAARSCRWVAEYVRTVAMPQRIGQRNCELLTIPIEQSLARFAASMWCGVIKPGGHSATRDPLESIGAPRNRVTYRDLKYFYRTVQRPEDYLPLVVCLRARYVDEVDYVMEPRDDGTSWCSRLTLNSIAHHWIHIGLVNCARLIMGSVKYIQSQGGCAAAAAQKPQSSIRIALDPDDSQATLLHYAIRASRDMSELYFVYDDLRRIIDSLDAPHFNLLIEAVSNNMIIQSSCEVIVASNAARPRYDPFFVNRVAARMGVLSHGGRDSRWVVVAGKYVEGSREKLLEPADDDIYGNQWISVTRNIHDDETQHGILRAQVRVPIDFAGSHGLNTMHRFRQFEYFHLVHGPAVDPVDVLRPCADCIAAGDDVTHVHRKRRPRNYNVRQCKKYNQWVHKCECKCECSNAAWFTNPFALLAECECHTCCPCEFACYCTECVCGAPCPFACVCCPCDQTSPDADRYLEHMCVYKKHQS